MNDQELAEHLAREAGRLLRDLRTHAEVLSNDVDEQTRNLARKALGNEGDRTGHDFLTTQLAVLRPEDAVFSEEGSGDLGRLDADRVWIVDPLDGTSEYSSHRSDYAIHVALWQSTASAPSKLIAAAVAVPELDIVWGMHGKAAIAPNSERPITILISRTRPPAQIGAIEKNLAAAFPDRGVELLPMGSVGAKVGHIMAGHADMYINTGGFYEWDLAAPLGVAVDQGLVVCDVQGNEFSFNNADPKLTSAIVTRPEYLTIILESLQ